MRTGRSALLLSLTILVMASGVSAQIPALLNYQVMLTDDLDQPLADQVVVMVFTIYDAESGGTALWTETHNPTTNSIGVVSIVLGGVTPIGFDFDMPLWLEVEVDGETLSPRRELTAAPYAGHAAGADDSDKLGGIDAGEYALLDDIGSDGHSLDADDGDPVDAVYVDSEGKVGIGTTTPLNPLHVKGSARIQDYGLGVTALWIASGDPTFNGVALYSYDDSGGHVEVNHDTGQTAADLGANSHGGGGGFLRVFRDDSWNEAFEVNGNNGGSGEPKMTISGTTSEIVFDLSQSDNATVQLPTDAIDANEVFDEPGVSSIQADSWRDVGDSVVSVAARYVDAPAAGYVFISATALVEFDNRTNQGHFVYLGLSELLNAWSTHAQEFYVSIPGGEYGHYYDTVTVTGIFEVAEGTHTFYLNAREFTGEVRIGERQFNVLYFPTAYGTVDLDD